MKRKNKTPKPGRPVKVIIIDKFRPRKPHFYPKPDEDLYYVASWGGWWARHIKERYLDLDIEVWRPESEFSKISYRKAFGVDCTIFPARKIIIPNHVTLQMLGLLFKYKQDYNLIFHVNSIFSWRFNVIMPFLFPGVKIVLSHHGRFFPTGSGLKQRLKRKVLKFGYRRIDSVTYLRDEIRKVIEDSNSKIKLTFLPVGANFEHFKPLDKIECRKKLNLPLNKVLAVKVGMLSKVKGVDKILTIYHQLKINNFSVLFAGGEQSNELYHEVIKSGCRYFGYVNHDLLRLLYAAADFYIHPMFDFTKVGFDVALIEAMACNRPVLSTQLKELDFDYSELGLLISDEHEMISKTKMMIEQFENFTRCREVAIKHLDINTAIIDRLFQIYCS